ncbi:PQQ-binding-like beta-propeller repeat protein [Duganella sp. LX20W]|uniref:PQQ-binding-like beta-propeller repeat protein n=1 Tax=Rugamonas brunnea TaxID=2758569 RepID=A0A7W2ETC0_9BURK|nr:PQQ-binding-like beta-propeller repeat protein [Rugamonas brunnea]MBA5638253.1 PQQ-binding-like beta-propeller repeat protein [Rugamonas brunnea]
MRKSSAVATTVVGAGLIVAGLVYFNWNKAVPVVAMGINYVRYLSAPAGTLRTETATPAPPPQPTPAPQVAAASGATSDQTPGATAGDWPSYNKTLTSNRFSPLRQINKQNVGRLAVQCTYDTGQYTGFNSGLLEVNGALIAVTEYDIFSLDPTNCHLNWRTHEDYTPASPQGVNRGAAYMDGRLFRGTQDGRVLAYDFKTGKRLWATTIADPRKGESVPAAPIAWQGRVFVGNAGGDVKGVKGRMYALDARTGSIVWEFYLVPKQPADIVRGPEAASPLDGSTWNNAPGSPITGGATWTSYTLDPATGLLYVPGGNPAPDFATGPRAGANLYSGSVVVLDAKTGAYRRHFKIVPVDWHDWDVSSAPAILHTAGGTTLLSVAPKDGHLYGINLKDGDLLYRKPVTRVENADQTFSSDKAVHFCPGSVGGAEWNGPAFDPENNLVMVGEVDWCTTVTLQSSKQIADVAEGTPWSGEATINPYHTWGKQDPFGDWAGWLYASDADTGAWKWRVKTNYPIQSGVTPTGGGLVFFGDMGGNFYAVDADNGRKLWGRKIDGAVGGGVITYEAGGAQKVAVATGLTEILWPTEITTAKVSVLGLEGGHQ